eukprot:3743934-Rhodomonas_salina.1
MATIVLLLQTESKLPIPRGEFSNVSLGVQNTLVTAGDFFEWKPQISRWQAKKFEQRQNYHAIFNCTFSLTPPATWPTSVHRVHYPYPGTVTAVKRPRSKTAKGHPYFKTQRKDFYGDGEEGRGAGGVPDPERGPRRCAGRGGAAW